MQTSSAQFCGAWTPGVQDLAPYALYSTYWDQAMSPAHLPAVQGTWPKALPGQQSEEGTGLTGFTGPTMCQQVFQSTAAEGSAQATQRAQRFLAAGTSMRGSGSIALPPVEEGAYRQVAFYFRALTCSAVQAACLSPQACFTHAEMLSRVVDPLL